MKTKLLVACVLASVAMQARDIKPVLKNIKAIAGDGLCTLMATDMEVGIRLDVQRLTIQEPDEAILLAILRETRDSELEIETEPSACAVKGPSLEFETPSEDPTQSPDLPTVAENKFHNVARLDRRLALAQGTATGYTTRGQAPVVPTKAMNLLENVKICQLPKSAFVPSRLFERQVIPHLAAQKDV